MTRCCENIDKKSTLTIIVEVLFCCEIFANDSYAEEDQIIKEHHRKTSGVNAHKAQIFYSTHM